MVASESEAARIDAVRALEAEFAQLLDHVRRVVAANAERVSPGMLPGAYKVFTTIVRLERVTQSALAETLMADKGQISRAVKDLETLDLIERTPDPADGRSSILTPTRHGRERLAAARQPQEDSFMRVLQQWDVADIAHLTRLLSAVNAGSAP